MRGLFDRYQANLKKAYAAEAPRPTSGYVPKASRASPRRRAGWRR